MTTEEMIKALEADGFKVERPQPKGPVMEPEDEARYWFAFPFGKVLNLQYQDGNEGDDLYCESCRIFHTEAEAEERNEQGAKGEWRMIHVPTEWQRFYREVLNAPPYGDPSWTLGDFTDQFFGSLMP